MKVIKRWHSSFIIIGRQRRASLSSFSAERNEKKLLPSPFSEKNLSRAPRAEADGARNIYVVCFGILRQKSHVHNEKARASGASRRWERDRKCHREGARASHDTTVDVRAVVQDETERRHSHDA